MKTENENCIKRYFRLKNIRQVRRMRDEILTSGNSGLAKRILSEMPRIQSISIDEGWTVWIRVTMDNGHDILVRGSHTLHTVKEAAAKVCKWYTEKLTNK